MLLTCVQHNRHKFCLMSNLTIRILEKLFFYLKKIYLTLVHTTLAFFVVVCIISRCLYEELNYRSVTRCISVSTFLNCYLSINGSSCKMYVNKSVWAIVEAIVHINNFHYFIIFFRKLKSITFIIFVSNTHCHCNER